MSDKLPDLNRGGVDRDPLKQFAKWLDEVRASGVSEQDAISMTLATATKDARPAARWCC